MFNNTLKNEAIQIHKNAVERYNKANAEMKNSCERLYSERENALTGISKVEVLFNTIANTPKEFDKQLGEIKNQVLQFHETKEFARKAYKEAVKSGINVVAGAAAATAVATTAPTIAMSIATTFGHAATGTAISSLSGAAAQKAAIAWIGRKSLGIATHGVIHGAGMASGQAFLALAGPVGWSISAVATTVSLVSLNSKNKKVAQEAMEEAKDIMQTREVLRETTAKIDHLQNEVSSLYSKLKERLEWLSDLEGIDYTTLSVDEKYELGTILNNTNSLAALLNQTIE